MINDTMKERTWRIINTVRGVNDEAYQMLIYVLFLKYISEYKDRLELGFDEKYSIEYLALLYGKVVDIINDVVIVEFGLNKAVRIPVKKVAIAGVQAPNLSISKQPEVGTRVVEDGVEYEYVEVEEEVIEEE